jgi:hypothetical protein
MFQQGKWDSGLHQGQQSAERQPARILPVELDGSVGEQLPLLAEAIALQTQAEIDRHR